MKKTENSAKNRAQNSAKKTLCLAVADIHGNKIQYEKILKIAQKEKISYIFLAGDLLPKTGGSWNPENKIRTIKMQKNFIENFFIKYLENLGKISRVFAIFGNDDFCANYDFLAGQKIKNVKFLCNEVVKIPHSDFFVAGYPFVGATPFLHKDWEKWDKKIGEIPHKIFRADGYVSKKNQHFPINLMENSDSIFKDLENLRKKSDPKKTVYIFHEAPENTPLDQISPENKFIKDGNLHVGSVSLREFIENFQPFLTLHGHIHETFSESGNFKFILKKSVSATPANDFSREILSYLIFNFENPREISRREI